MVLTLATDNNLGVIMFENRLKYRVETIALVSFFYQNGT